MRILAFAIGEHRLGLPAEYVSSVGRGGVSPSAGSGPQPAEEYDLCRAFGAGGQADRRVINCEWNGRGIRLLADRIIGLVDLDDQTLAVWPSILGGIRLFYALGMADTAMYLLLDLSQIETLKSGA
jgi:hypothetical protein